MSFFFNWLGLQTLNVGVQAPDFTTVDQHGKSIALKALRGKKVVLYFYPMDNTPGCTKQACNIRDNWAALQQKNIVVLGVSTDNHNKHQKFTKDFGLPFSLLVDTAGQIAKSYGVYNGLIKMNKRVTYLINEEGVIQHVISSPNVQGHAEEIMALWK